MELQNSSDYNCCVENKEVYIGFSAVMIVELILGLPLNISVLYLFIFKLKFWKSNSNMVFLFNLVLADLLLLICLPVKVQLFQRGERCSEDVMACKAMLFLLVLNRSASIAFLTVICIDRYLSVVHPSRNNVLRPVKQMPRISVLIWVLLLPLTVPTMLKTLKCGDDYGPEGNYHMDVLREFIFFSQILVPFIILVYCTTRIVRRLRRKTVGNRRKLRRAVFAVTSVVLVFSLCFLPRTASRIAMLVGRHQTESSVQEVMAQVYDGIMSFSHMDCLLDPLVYCFCSSKFKDTYIATFFPCLQKKDEQESQC